MPKRFVSYFALILALGLAVNLVGAGDQSSLLDAVRSGTPSARKRALDDLNGLSDHDAKTVSVLIKVLGDPDPELRWRAARTLGATGRAAQSAIPSLQSLLEDENAKVRAYAAFALGEMQEAARPAGPALIKRITDPDALVRRAALRALRQIKLDHETIIPLFVQVLGDAEPSVIMPALHSIAENHRPGVPVLIEALKNKKAAFWATLIAQEIGPEAAPAVPGLTELLKSDEPEVRMHAALALAAIGPAARPASSAIADRLIHDDQNGVRYAAAYALGQIGAEGIELQLQRALQDDDAFLKLQCALAIARLNPKNQQAQQLALNLIIAGLESSDGRLQHGAARALVGLDLPLALVAQRLVKVARANPAIIDEAGRGIVQQGEQAVPLLVECLRYETLRLRAVKLLGSIGPSASAAVPALIETLRIHDPELGIEVQFALANIGAKAAPAVPLLVASLSGEGRMVTTACYALGKIGPAAESAVSSLEKLLSNDDPFLQIAAAWALLKIRPGDPKVIAAVVPLLVTGLDHEKEMVRREIVVLLGETGPPAAKSLPALRKRLTDPEKQVRMAAAKAIKQIEN